MDWQQIVALGVVAATASIFAWQRLRRRKSLLHTAKACGGCSSATQEPPSGSIVFRARKGQRREIIVKAG